MLYFLFPALKYWTQTGQDMNCIELVQKSPENWFKVLFYHGNKKLSYNYHVGLLYTLLAGEWGRSIFQFISSNHTHITKHWDRLGINHRDTQIA